MFKQYIMSDKTLFTPNTVYHIYNHANGDEDLFRTPENYFYFLNRYRHYIQPIAQTFAYCLMPNHFHFLINIRSEKELVHFYNKQKPDSNTDLSDLLSKRFSNLFNAYSKAFNKMYDRRGRLFESSLKRKAVVDERYLTILIRYIHLNPVLHAFVDEAARWRFSSLSAYHSEKPSYLDRKTVFDWFGGKRLFVEYHKNMLKEEVNRIRELTF